MRRAFATNAAEISIEPIFQHWLLGLEQKDFSYFERTFYQAFKNFGDPDLKQLPQLTSDMVATDDFQRIFPGLAKAVKQTFNWNQATHFFGHLHSKAKGLCALHIQKAVLQIMEPENLPLDDLENTMRFYVEIVKEWAPPTKQAISVIDLIEQKFGVAAAANFLIEMRAGNDYDFGVGGTSGGDYCNIYNKFFLKITPKFGDLFTKLLDDPEHHKSAVDLLKFVIDHTYNWSVPDKVLVMPSLRQAAEKMTPALSGKLLAYAYDYMHRWDSAKKNKDAIKETSVLIPGVIDKIYETDTPEDAIPVFVSLIKETWDEKRQAWIDAYMDYSDRDCLAETPKIQPDKALFALLETLNPKGEKSGISDTFNFALGDLFLLVKATKTAEETMDIIDQIRSHNYRNLGNLPELFVHFAWEKKDEIGTDRIQAFAISMIWNHHGDKALADSLKHLAENCARDTEMKYKRLFPATLDELEARLEKLTVPETSVSPEAGIQPKPC